MPDDRVTHVVEQGDHLSSIAARYGVASWRTLWDHPDNAELRTLRGNPNVLYPGDLVVIPQRVRRVESSTTECRHRFRTRPNSLVLRVTLKELFGRSCSSTPCRITVESCPPVEIVSDENGTIEHRISCSARDAILEIDGISIPLRIGHLDPVDQRSGQCERLRNLGYLPPASRGNERQPDASTFQAAVARFQRDQGITRDGLCGPVTQRKLVDAHGC